MFSVRGRFRCRAIKIQFVQYKNLTHKKSPHRDVCVFSYACEGQLENVPINGETC